jgi:NurA domain
VPRAPRPDIEGGTRLLVEDYAERVKGCAQYLTRLLADQGTRVDNPVDEPIAPEETAPLELAEDRGLVQFPVDPAPGVTAAAVDGGSACLVNGRSFWVIAYRAGTIWHRDRVTVHEDPAPLTIEALTQTDAKGRYAQALAAAGVVRERDLADLGGVVDVLRELAEWRRAREAIERAVPGDLILVDGSLHPGAFLPAALVVPIHELALEREVDLVGVTKASKLRWGRYAPLVLRVRRRAEAELGPDARWYLRVTRDPDEAPALADPDTGEAAPPWRSEVYVARLASRGPYAFRVDAVRGHREPEALFAVLAGLSDDPAFLGYPYPLARVHQVVSLSGHMLADLRRDLRAAFMREGLPEDDVDLVMRDFHLTLNA